MKIISFSSHTATWYFAVTEATIASALQKEGHDVLFITSGRQLGHISNLQQEKILRDEFNLKGYEIGTKLDNSDTKEIISILNSLDKNNFEKLIIDGVQVGKIALYEFLLHNKKMTVKITNREWKECLFYIKNTLISFFACRKIIKLEKPDRIVMFSTLYSVNRVWQKYAELMNIPTYFMDHCANLSDIDDTLVIGRTNTFYFFEVLKNIYSKIKNVPTSREELRYVTENLLEILKAKHFLVYSAPVSKKLKGVRKVFGIKDNQKIITTTMSSYDEIGAAQYVGAWKTPKKIVFEDQEKWIKALIDYVKNRQDLFLIIRVHPREFPNKRDGIKSDHAKMLEKLLKNLPENVKVNWPTDNISIYDLAQETDVFLNAWSSVGVEMSLLGIPVVIYSKDLILYPQDLNYLAKDKKDYFVKIELALKEGWSYKRIKKTYRWLALYYYHTIVRLRDKKTDIKPSILTRLFSNITSYAYRLLPSKVKNFLIKVYYAIPGLGVGKRQVNDCRRQLTEHVDISGVEKMIKESGDTLVDVEKILRNGVTEKEEDLYIRREVKRMYYALYEVTPDETKIMKDSLQYNLKQVFTKK